MRSSTPVSQRRTYHSLIALGSLILILALAGCGDTWRGFKKDTGENLKKTGDAIEEAGEEVSN